MTDGSFAAVMGQYANQVAPTTKRVWKKKRKSLKMVDVLIFVATFIGSVLFAMGVCAIADKLKND